MNFKEMDSFVKFIFDHYDTSELFEDYGRYLNSQLGDKIIEALGSLSKEDKFLICHEYLGNKDRGWWMQYYSRSSYYRAKSKAMKSFLNCMNK